MKNKNGFTLVELIVTICLIAALMAVAIPGIMKYTNGVSDDQLLSEARSVVSIAKSQVNQLSLSGQAGAQILDSEQKKAIVDKAHGKGYIFYIEFDPSTFELSTLTYIVNNRKIIYNSIDDLVYFSNS